MTLTEAEQQHAIARMWSAGVWFSRAPRWAHSGETIPPDVDLPSLDLNEWVAAYDVHFPHLSATDPNVTFVGTAAEWFRSDTAFADAVLRAVDSLISEAQETDLLNCEWGELL
ncbi:MAG: hypothetical protein K8U57_31390 [Planctomycetes bacterium]|nr:hypothetical protein [Planctomycetota bacterium]